MHGFKLKWKTLTALPSAFSFAPVQATFTHGTAPAFTTAPAINGTPQVGVATSYTLGAVTGAPAPNIQQQWTRDGVDIAGATSPTYTPTSGDAGHALRVREIATNASGSATSTSNPVTVSSASAPAFTSAPSIIGTPTVNVPCSYSPGTLSGSPAPTITQQWVLDGIDIGGATGVTYTPTIGNSGHALAVREIATNASGSASSTSAGVTVAASVSADFTSRATGAGVVWSHAFSADTEITAFCGPYPAGQAHAGPAIFPSRVADPIVGNAMRIYAFGATLTTNFLASGGAGPRALTIDDDTYWPDPAQAGVGNYYVNLTKPDRDQLNNLLLVTAKSGKTLTVTYIPSSGQPMSTTQRDWFAGDRVGAQCASTWYRLFSALKGDSNGRGVDDINNAGNILRSTHDQTNFPWGAQAFGYGWYGRPEYQTQFATWRPSDYGANAIDNVLRSNMWDGTEFYLQWRQRVDPRALALNNVAYNSDNRYGRKVWMLQSQMTVPQQLTGGYGPGGTRFSGPYTKEPPFAIAAYSFNGGLAGRTLTTNLDSSGSFQPGSAYASTAINGNADFLPKSPTYQGDVWEIPAGEWVTFLLHVKPGLRWSADNPTAAGVRNTTVEMWAARERDSSYTLVFSMTDQAIIYGSSGPNEDTWTSALPGYNAIGFTGYLNMDLGSVPPRGSYYVDFAEVIFSKQPIPCPTPVATIPSWVPSPGQVAVLTTSNGKLTNTFTSQCVSYFDPFFMPNIVNAYSSTFLNPYFGDYGMLFCQGAGHASTNNNQAVGLVLGKDTCTFQALIAPTPLFGSTSADAFANDTQNAGALVNTTWGEYTVDNKVGSQHSRSTFVCIPPAFGGAQYGSMAQATKWSIASVGVPTACCASHRVDFNALTGPYSWTRIAAGTLGNIEPNQDGCYVPGQNRIYVETNSSGGSNPPRWLDLTTKQYVFGTGARRDMNKAAFSSALFFVPSRDLLVFMDCEAGTGHLRLQYAAIRANADDVLSPQPSWTFATLSGGPYTVVAGWGVACWCEDNNRILAASINGDNAAVWEIDIPLVVTNTWTVTRAPFGAGQSIGFIDSSDGQATSGVRWTYNPKTKSIVYYGYAATSGNSDTVWAYRPRGT